MKEKYTSEERAEVSSGFRRLIVTLLVLMFVVFAYTVFSAAWFALGESASANGMQVAVRDASSKSYTLYLWDEGLNSGSGGWTEASSVNMLSAVPNQCNRYLLVSDSAFDSIVFNLGNVTADNGNPDSEDLLDYIYIHKAAEYTDEKDPALFLTGLPTNFGYEESLGANEVSLTVAANNTYSLACSDAASVVFDVYISKEVCNYFSLWGFSGTVIIE